MRFNVKKKKNIKANPLQM